MKYPCAGPEDSEEEEDDDDKSEIDFQQEGSLSEGGDISSGDDAEDIVFDDSGSDVDLSDTDEDSKPKRRHKRVCIFSNCTY